MVAILSCPGSIILFLSYLGICFTNFPTAAEDRPRLHIFHHSCALKKDEGPCKALKERFYFDIDTARCESFEYGGCQGNANNFESLEACEEMCLVRANKSPCHLKDEAGPCRGLMPRFFFDSETQECRRFFYGGCFGNANNFKTIQECQARCQSNNTQEHRDDPKPRESVHPTGEAPSKDKDIAAVSHTDLHVQPRPESHRVFSESTLPNLCLSAIDEGQCDGIERRFAYNHRTKRCEMFHYTGCGGNKNNFAKKKHCMKTCMKDHRRKQIRIKTRKFHLLQSKDTADS
ncbi:tissue factor pathway inhibitor a isoform X2 [Brachyhypopomus gauderio]|uniref:tissue factor pathway inhibitor a isoform X2 n=1 Tax=Brachyhypopomus gauderio TaxID=698409 RepID=UPI004041C70E